MSREFIQLNAEGYRLGPYFIAETPYSAALRAATRGCAEIFLLERKTEKLFGYVGFVETLESEKRSTFQVQNKITALAKIKSLGPARNVKINPNFDWD